MDAQITVAEQAGLVFVPPDALQPQWGWLKPRLELVAKRSGARWIPEDVYAAVKSGAASLFIVERPDAERLGVLVVQPIRDFDAKILSVWVLHNEGKEDIIGKCEDDLVRMARQMGARRIGFTSARRGWGRRLERFGYREVGRIYEKEI